MIPLTKETIDNLFTPRREIQTAAQLEAACGRLLIDGKGRYYCLKRQRGVDHAMYFHWLRPNRNGPESERNQYFHFAGWKKGTWPVWVDTDIATNNPWSVRPADHLPIWEVLPTPTWQGQILIAFYRIAFPNWDAIVKIDGYPRVSEATWKYIMDKFMAFDRHNHPDVVPGGMWCLGSGFSNAHNDPDKATVPDWYIDLSQCKAVFHDTPYYFTIHRSDYGDNDEYSSFYPTIIWDGGMQEALEDPDTELRRRNSFEAAVAACEKRAGGRLAWSEVPPMKFNAVWQSSIVQPQTQAA